MNPVADTDAAAGSIVHENHPMTKPTPTRYPNCIRQLRMEKGLTQRQLARIMGYESVSSLSHLEGGHKRPSMETIFKLEAALQRPIRDIYSRLFDEIYDPVARRRVKHFEAQLIPPAL